MRNGLRESTSFRVRIGPGYGSVVTVTWLATALVALDSFRRARLNPRLVQKCYCLSRESGGGYPN